MAKPKNNKAGLHKNVSSVLEGVPIPQGVRNWQPPDMCGPNRTGDSSAVLKSNVSSVFKGVTVAPGDGAKPPAGKHPQSCAEVPPIETPIDRQTSQSTLVKEPDCPEESTAKDVWTEEPEFVNEVVCYRDPTKEVSRTLGQWILDNFFALGEWLWHLFRRSSTKKG